MPVIFLVLIRDIFCKYRYHGVKEKKKKKISDVETQKVTRWGGGVMLLPTRKVQSLVSKSYSSFGDFSSYLRMGQGWVFSSLSCHVSVWEGLAFVVHTQTASNLGKGFNSRSYWFRHKGLSHWGSLSWTPAVIQESGIQVMLTTRKFGLLTETTLYLAPMQISCWIAMAH